MKKIENAVMFTRRNAALYLVNRHDNPIAVVTRLHDGIGGYVWNLYFFHPQDRELFEKVSSRKFESEEEAREALVVTMTAGGMWFLSDAERNLL